MNKQKLKQIQDKFLTGELYHTDIIADILEALLDEPKAVDVTPPVKHVKWRTEKGGFYYYINDMGSIYQMKEEGHHINDYQHLTGNYYQTKEEAEKALEVIKAKGRLSHAYYGLVGDWKPDWSDSSQDKYSFYYEYAGRFETELNTLLDNLRPYYFPTKELVNQFIKENEEDLRLVFNIND